jgi:hypothetical protein
VLFAKYNYNDEVKEDEIGTVYSTNVGHVIGGKARRKESTGKTKL